MTDTPMTADEVRKIIFAFTSVDAGEIHTPHGSIDLRDMCKRLASLADLLERKAPDYLRLIIDGVICDAVERGHSTGSDTDRILALIQPAVKVKALEWRDGRAVTPLGIYSTDEADGDRRWVCFDGRVIDSDSFATLETAKAAAQAHYDAAIREALEPSAMLSAAPTGGE